MAATDSRSSRYRWMIPILLCAFLLRIARLDVQSIWYDEAFYATVSGVDLTSFLDMMLDVRLHPPLYFLLLHFWLGLGHGEFMLRALSAFAGVLTVAAMCPLGTMVGGRKLGAMGAFAMAICPFHIWYSQEVKMYALIAFLVALSCYFFLRIEREDSVRSWLGYALLTLFAVYTHYLALFVVVAQMFFLVLLRRQYQAILGKWLLCMVTIGLLFAPWLAAVFLRGGFYDVSISWIPPARPTDLFWTIYDFGFGSTLDNTHPASVVAGLLLVGVLAYVFAQLLAATVSAEERNRLLFVLIWLCLPLLLVFLISLDWPLPQKRSIYMDRYLILLLPAFVIVVCYGTMSILRIQKTLGALIVIALLIPVTVSTYSLFFDPRYHRDQWRQAITEIRQNVRSEDILLVRPHQKVVLYYYDLQEMPWCTVPYLGSTQEYEDFLDFQVPACLSEGGRVWTIIVSENANAHRFVDGSRDRLLKRVAEDEVRGWLLQHSQLVDESIYTGVYLASFGGIL